MKARILKISSIALKLLLCLALLANMAVFSLADDPEVTTEEPADMDQLVLNKTAKVKDENTFTLTIETYVAGEVIYVPTEVETPTDIVMVLDQSSSMRYNFAGESESDTSKRRQKALQNAACTFIDQMSGENQERFNKADHRISVVTFGNSASTLAGWTPLNASGVATLKNKINDLTISSNIGTQMQTGMQRAEELLDPEEDYKYSGDYTDRNKAVVLFTDGFPGDSGFEMDVANATLASAQRLKNSGVLVFTVGIFDGADEDNTYGSKDYYQSIGLDVSDSNIRTRGGSKNGSDFYELSSNGAVGTRWLVNKGDYEYYPAANRFLNYASSNCPTVTTMGLTADDESEGILWGKVTWYGYKITANATRENSKYYLTAEDAASLTDAFTRISDWIKAGGTTIKLDERAVVKDIVSDYFELTTGDVKDIHTYVAPCTGVDATGAFTFGERVATAETENPEFHTVQVVLSDYVSKDDKRNVSVTGFDFTKHYVAYDATAEKACGYKLIIEFDITPIEGFTGGNDIPTNNPESGVYPTPDSDAAGRYPEPEVNLPLTPPEFDITFPDFVIYQGNMVCIDPLFSMEDMDEVKDYFVDREIKYNDTVYPGGIFMPTETTTYPAESVSVTLYPKTETPSGSVGEKAEPITVKNTEPFTIYVLEPKLTVTSQDEKLGYGTEFDIENDCTVTPELKWIESLSGTEMTPSEGFVPEVTLADLKWNYVSVGYTGVVPKNDVTVAISPTYLDGSALDFAVEYVTTCAESACADRNDATYKIHTVTGDITIVNNGGASTEEFVYKIYKDGVLYTQVSVKGGASVTLSGLPMGEYTVEADTAWKWRYTSTFSDDKDSETLTMSNPTATFTCTNVKQKTKWSSANDSVVNAYERGDD